MKKPAIPFFSEDTDVLPSTNKAGVAIKVKNVAKVRPPAIVLERSTHHWTKELLRVYLYRKTLWLDQIPSVQGLI